MIKRLHNKAFTLIELLVVLVIIGIILSFVLLATGQLGKDRQLKSFANHIHHLIPLLQQQALLYPATIGIAVSEQRLDYYRYVAKEDGSFQWQALPDHALLAWQSMQGIQLSLTTDQKLQFQKASGPNPQIVLYPSGTMTAFRLRFALSGESALWEIIGKRNGEVILQAVTT